MRFATNEIGFCTNDVEDYVGGEVTAEFVEPDAHFFEGGLICYAVAENAGVCAAVVEPRDGAEAFLACCIPNLKADDLVVR